MLQLKGWCFLINLTMFDDGGGFWYEKEDLID